MEEQSYCNLSLAVDCTLSLGSTTSRGAEIPARLSRAGSPDQDLTWSLAVRSDQRVDSSLPHTCEQDLSVEQAMSWGGSCDRSDPGVSLEYFPQVSETEGRVSDGARNGLKAAWPRSSPYRATHSYKDGVSTSKAALLSMIKNTQSYSNRSSRQPWLSNYISSNAVVEVKAAASRVEQCMQEGDSFVRVCAHCDTSKTPLWRNGPGGPKSLCNACGIRFKKAGRRSAANGTSELQLSPPTTPKVTKRKLADEEQPYWLFPPDAKPRKRSRGSLLRASDSLLSESCMTWQSLPLQRVDSRPSLLSRSQAEKKGHLDLQSGSYSSDEEEGAVLLMALSCGMVNA